MTLSAFELEELIVTTDARLEDLAARGIGVGGAGEHWLQELILQLIDGAQLHQAKEKHYQWLNARLDEADEKIREMILTQGIARDNGSNRATRRHPG
jgi:hypothetical protein